MKNDVTITYIFSILPQLDFIRYTVSHLFKNFKILWFLCPLYSSIIEYNVPKRQWFRKLLFSVLEKYQKNNTNKWIKERRLSWDKLIHNVTPLHLIG